MGQPIAHNGDLYGADVNLVSRLCSEAAPDEIVLCVDEGAGTELVRPRGIPRDIPIVRRSLR